MKFLDPEKGLRQRLCSIEPMTMMMGGSGLASMGGNIFGSLMGKSSASKQAEMIGQTMEKSKDIALQFNEKAWHNLGIYAQNYAAPVFNRGLDAGAQLQQMLTTGKMPYALEESNLFKFEQGLGTRDINRQLKARGLYGSGAGLETLGRFEQELVAKEGQRTWDRLAGGFTNLAQMGVQAGNQALAGASGLAQSTSGLGGTVAQTTMQGGLAQAGAVGQAGQAMASLGQGIAGPINQGLGNFMQYDLLKPLLGGMNNNRPGADGGVSVVVNPETQPLGMSAPAPDYSDFSFFG